MNGLDSIERNGNFFLLKNSSGHHQLILLDIDLKVAECKQCACKGDQPCKNHKNENSRYDDHAIRLSRDEAEGLLIEPGVAQDALDLRKKGGDQRKCDTRTARSRRGSR